MIFLIVIFLQPDKPIFSQTKEDFSIYVFKHRFGAEGKEYIQNNSIFKEIKLLGGVMIDPGRKGEINLESVKKYLTNLYPNSTDRGILCINLENKLYKDLRDKNKDSPEFQIAVQEFVKMLEFIRKFRPYIKFGIYGLPFRTYYPIQLRRNADRKLDPILSLTDFIFPSLYVLYPDKQKGEEANNQYFTINLDTAFSYANRLGKPVIPFIWYMVNVGNRRYGGELLGKKEFKRYIDFIKNFKYKENKKIEGVVWWQSTKKSFNIQVKHASHLNCKGTELNIDNILQEYVDFLNY